MTRRTSFSALKVALAAVLLGVLCASAAYAQAAAGGEMVSGLLHKVIGWIFDLLQMLLSWWGDVIKSIIPALRGQLGV